MRRSLPIMLLCAALCMVSCANRNSKKSEAQASKDEQKTVMDSLKLSEKLASMPDEPVFDIITTLGTIRVKLYSNTPKHRENFARLAFEGFYDGILFHRVINGFMIQTGDPLSKDADKQSSWGTGGPGYTVPAEILPENTHLKGALAAARRSDRANPLRESSGSQFYIVQDERTCAQLDGAYTVFGQTIEGFEVIDKIASVATDSRDCPLSPVKIVAVKLVQ
ncbi:MAG: peptidylprolyl isomerase [Candidatus Cryptobacteroides sp.]